MKKIFTKKKVIISSIVALLLIGGAYNATRPVDVPVGVSEGSTRDDSKKDEPILVKDPETGETKAVTKEEIKNNPSLAKNVIVNPTKNDYKEANVSAPSDPRPYNCVREYYEATGERLIVADLGGSFMQVNLAQCKTVSDKTIKKDTGYQPPASTPDPVYVSSSYMKDNYLYDGTCSSEYQYAPSITMWYEADRQQPSTTLDSDCKQYVLTQTKMGWLWQTGEIDENGQVQELLNGYIQYWYKKNTKNVPYRIAVCTLNDTSYYKEASGDGCTLYKQNQNGWSLTKI